MRAVFEHHALRSQFVADAVGLGEVARLLGFGARGDEGLDAGHVQTAGRSRITLQIRLGRLLQDADDTPQRLQQARDGQRTAAVQLRGQLEQHGQRDGGVEVLVHRGFEARGVRLRPVDVGKRHLARVHAAQGRVQAAQAIARIFQAGIAVIEGAAVLGAQHEEAHCLAVVVLEHIADGEEVAQRLGHLLVVHIDETVVQPVIDEALAAGTFALRDLVLVVRELQVQATTVDVELLTEQAARHGRALDVPARAARAIGRFVLGVGRLFRLGGLPQHEVQRVLLAVIDRHALAGTQLVQALARQLAVALELAHGVVHIAIRGAVGQALVFQLADEVEHLTDVLGGAGLVRGRLDAQRGDVLVHGQRHLVGELADGDAALHRTADDLVVDVRDVAHIGHAIAAGLEPALHHVERHHHAGMADMAEVVDGHAAHVHADLTGRHRNEGLNLA